MFSTAAFAQDAAAIQGPGLFEQLFPFVLIMVIFYFLLIRPQMKRQKEHQAMVEAVKRGDTVVTAGGLIGKVVKVKEDGELDVELAKDVVVRVVKSTLTDVRVKGEPAKPAKDDSDKKAKKK